VVRVGDVACRPGVLAALVPGRVIVDNYPRVPRVAVHDNRVGDGRGAWCSGRAESREIRRAGLWYGCDALALGWICVTDLSAGRKAVRIATGYLSFITKEHRGGRTGGDGDTGPGRFAAERGRSGRDPSTPGGVIERHITGFFRIFSNIWSCPGNTTSIPLYRTVVHVQNGARRQLRALSESPRHRRTDRVRPGWP